MSTIHKYQSAKDRYLGKVKGGGYSSSGGGCGSNLSSVIGIGFVVYVVLSKIIWTFASDPWLIWLPGNFLFGTVIKIIKFLTPLYIGI